MNKPAFITLPLLGLIIILSASVYTHAHASTNRAAIMLSSFELSSQKWKNRVLLVFAPSINDSVYRQQMKLFQDHKSGLSDRDLVLVQVLANGESYANSQLIDPSSASQLRDGLKVRTQDFCVILVGKDGGVKRRETTPVEAKAIFAQIDAMPMRQQEIKERGR